MKLQPLIFSHGTLHAVFVLPSETENAETKSTHLDSISTLVVQQDVSSPKNHHTNARAHPKRSPADTPCTKRSHSHPWGSLGSVPHSSLLYRRNSNGCTYQMALGVVSKSSRLSLTCGSVGEQRIQTSPFQPKSRIVPL